MRRYIYPEEGFVEKSTLQEGCWLKVVSPNTEDLSYLTEELQIPDSFLADIADIDERPRTEEEDGWYLTIIRIPVATNDDPATFTTVPIGVISSPEKHIVVTVCYHRSQLMPDFIGHVRRKRIVITNEADFRASAIRTISISLPESIGFLWLAGLVLRVWSVWYASRCLLYAYIMEVPVWQAKGEDRGAGGRNVRRAKGEASLVYAFLGV